MIDASALGLASAFAAGFVSFLSPCVLPLVPGFISYIAGQRSAGSEQEFDLRTRLRALALSVVFVLGFSAIFILFGASATALGQLLLRYRYEANVVGGGIVIVFGLFMLGLARRASWLYRDLRFHPQGTPGHPLGAFVLGLAFGFGWTPCIGPVLGAILTVSAVHSSASGGIALLAAYAVGLGMPFLVSALFLRELLGRLKRLRDAGRPLQVAAGLIMVAMGALMVTGELSALSYWLLERFPVLGQIG